MWSTEKNKEQTTPTLVYHHLGLGDCIILSGGLKYLRQNERLGQVFYICKHCNLNSVKQLFADISGFEIIAVADGMQADILASEWKGKKMLIGFEKILDWQHFDIDFYRIIGVEFKERWDSFSIKRNFEEERILLDEINLPEKFAFVHDDPSRGYNINTAHVKSGLPIIKPFVSNNFFNWIAVLEKATEIHCICSSFRLLTDSLPQINSDLFYHYSYVNGGKPREASVTVSRKEWKLL